MGFGIGDYWEIGGVLMLAIMRVRTDGIDIDIRRGRSLRLSHYLWKFFLFIFFYFVVDSDMLNILWLSFCSSRRVILLPQARYICQILISQYLHAEC